MKSRLSKALVLGLITGIVGLGVSLLPFGLRLEENVGLEILFHLRGVRQAPSDVIIVSIDKESTDNLNLPEDPRKWPRSLHARLTEILAKQGAAVIAFDIFFDEHRSTEEDAALTEAMRKTHNVVLSSYLKSERVPLADRGGSPAGDLSIVRLALPISSLEQSAVGVAPFPLPKIPVKVSQYWTFEAGAGGTPTLPVVAFQVFSLEVYGEFIRLLEKASPYGAVKLPEDKDSIVAAGGVEKLVRNLRDIFEKDPVARERMLSELEHSRTIDEKKARKIKSLIQMYKSANSHYLNFYGPPRTITTIPYYQVVRSGGYEAGGMRQPDVTGKAVFVGHSELYRSEQKDGFYTVFSQPDGLDISGVEIAATAFANLLEDVPVQPLSFSRHIALLCFWGLILGILCRLLSPLVSALGVIGLSILYLIAAEYQFKTAGSWYPLVLPLFFQTSLAFFGSVLWKYVDANKERQNIREAFGFYFPNEMVDKLSKNIADLKGSSELVYGICLYTDVAHYTSLCESLEKDLKALVSLMNKYFEAVFDPVKKHGGIVSDVFGDSMLAIWVAAGPEAVLRNKACLAALGISSAIDQFNLYLKDLLQNLKLQNLLWDPELQNLQLHTRIGLHSGHILLGNIGAIDHYEYRPTGDIVNTTARLEGLSKQLGTRILVSEKVIHQLDGFLTREVGKFLLVGKTKPLVVHELLCRMEDSREEQRNVCAIFASALEAFRRQSWDAAMDKFHKISEEDGPSRFYMNLCEYYKMNPPGESWDRIVKMDKK